LAQCAKLQYTAANVNDGVLRKGFSNYAIPGFVTEKENAGNATAPVS